MDNPQPGKKNGDTTSISPMTGSGSPSISRSVLSNREENFGEGFCGSIDLTPVSNPHHRPRGQHRACRGLSPQFEDTDHVESIAPAAFLEMQAQTIKTSVDAPNARADEERSTLFETIKERLIQMTRSDKDLSKPIQDQKSSSKMERIQNNLDCALYKNSMMEKRYLRLKARYNALEAKFQETTRKLEQTTNERNTQRRIDSGSTFANSRKSTDDAIQSKWKQLDYNIRNLAHFLTTAPPADFSDAVVFDRFAIFHPPWRKSIWDDDFRVLLMRGYLWCAVKDLVFEARGDTGGLKIAHLRAQERNNSPGPFVQRVAGWHAQASLVLEDLWDYDEKELHDLITIETHRLRPFWSAQSVSPDISECRTLGEMKEILEGALELDSMLMGSKAIFTPSWTCDYWEADGKLRYNSDAMEVLASDHMISEHSLVVFFTSPALYKMGNANGQNYDSRVALIKASVVCD
ncbi:hypothetical protein G7Z17_g12788 [Cylindrodendrum hubeiense]|uniref:Uncharacterized protein n=1 Tax=Cylindrodendrum hubeiense TaxID=595255 RepID=A0A9P5GXN1_9HYPO|nr:hypothetical protein G7Z17_g12788 [Cylindrodendrum hubeiense]